MIKKEIAQAIFDPGAFVGYKGERSLTDWQLDAVMSVLDKYATWTVNCGSGIAPNPKFDNEADAFERCEHEKSIPSYFGEGHKRQASVHKCIEICEEVKK